MDDDEKNSRFILVERVIEELKLIIVQSMKILKSADKNAIENSLKITEEERNLILYDEGDEIILAENNQSVFRHFERLFEQKELVKE